MSDDAPPCGAGTRHQGRTNGSRSVPALELSSRPTTSCTAAALYFGHAFLPGASPIARTLASFATLGVWGNPDTLVNNAAIITINDLEHTSVTDFPRVLQLRWWTAIDRSRTLPTAHDLDISA